MLLTEFLQPRGGWQFDFRSALIGALLASIVAGAIYAQREVVVRVARSLWEPVAAWRRRLRASQEEKYVNALQKTLKRLLFLEPQDPELIFRPPTLQALAPLPASVAEVAVSPRTIAVPYAALLAGHPKVVLLGAQGTGRTTTLMMSVWRSLLDASDGEGHGRRLPVWVDLALLAAVKEDSKASAAERIVALSSAHLPDVLPKWLLQQLRREPCLVLMDNWESLAPGQRTQVAHWVAEANEGFEDVFWMVASCPEGYSDLTEAGFVPAEIVPDPDRRWDPTLYEAWRRMLGKDSADVDEENLAALARATDAGAPVWELHLRTVLYALTGEVPERPVEVADRYLQAKIGTVDLGKTPGELAEQARQICMQTLVGIAAEQRLGGLAALSEQRLRELLEANLPPKSGRPRRLDSIVRKLLVDGTILQGDGKRWCIAHPIWMDFFAALHLAQDEGGQAFVAAHLDDPTWTILSEFYAGLADVETMAQALLRKSEVEGNKQILLRVSRWGIVADPEQPSRKALMKMLAQSFMQEGLDAEIRLGIGKALAIADKEGARAFFVRMLRYPSGDIRAASLRGLGWCGSPGDNKLLAAALQDGNPVVREGAVRALRDAGTTDAVTALAEALPQVDEALMRTIAVALAATPEGWQVLDEASKHEDLLVRRAAAFGLGRVEADWAREQLEEIAREDPEWLVRSGAEMALQAQDERDEQRIRIPAPPKPDQLDWLIAWAARQGTGLGVGEAAVEMLVRAAREGNADAKVLSALTLAQIGRDSDLTVLEPLLGNLDPIVAQTATWAINRIRQRHRIFQGA